MASYSVDKIASELILIVAASEECAGQHATTRSTAVKRVTFSGKHFEERCLYMNLEPLTGLALSMENNKGVYALLLGSGVSHTANIKTGWGIMTDLIMKIAHVQGATGEAEKDPVAWFTQTFEDEPGYSSLLEMLEPTQATRSSLIAPYFERSAEDQENGDKQPTKAHKAIAKLVKAGYIKVILTTNFDRLMEQALEAESIQPTVIANSNDIPGAMPLVHERTCTIVKLHGDYKDLDTKNTYGELEIYDNALNSYIDRIFDDYGLIVCGWSGEWDTALRNAILRCPNRRFQTYWISRGEPGEKAREIINHRKAQSIPTAGADELFVELEEKVHSIAEYRQVHPVSVQIATATVKRYLAEEKYRIKLHDFVMQEVDRFLEATKDREIHTGTGDDIVKRYLNLSEVLQHIFATGGYWSRDGDIELWEKALVQIQVSSKNELAFNDPNDSIRKLYRFIILTLTYAYGMAALAGNKYSSAINLLKRILFYHIGNFEGTLATGEIERFLSKVPQGTGSDKIFTHLQLPLREFARHTIPTPMDHYTPYHRVFDELEYFIDIIQFQHLGKCQIGRKRLFPEEQVQRGSIIKHIEEDITKQGKKWLPLRNGLCDAGFETFIEYHEKYKKLLLENNLGYLTECCLEGLKEALVSMFSKPWSD